jgi:hypothetical protein
MPDISAAVETHLNRAVNVLSKHAKNVNRAVQFISITQTVVRVEGIQLNLIELQEEVRDIAEVIEALRLDAMDILDSHIDFARDIEDKLRGLNIV